MTTKIKCTVLAICLVGSTCFSFIPPGEKSLGYFKTVDENQASFTGNLNASGKFTPLALLALFTIAGVAQRTAKTYEKPIDRRLALVEQEKIMISDLD